MLNFSAGPSTLPEEVLCRAQEDLWSLFGTGIGVLEHSHRGAAYTRVLEEALADWRSVGEIPDDYECLFIQGGASLQMAMLPMSFLAPGRVADYLDTGRWAHDALVEARKLGKVNVVCSSRDSNYDHVPPEHERRYTPDAAYVHYCENNTVFGTHMLHPPAAPTGVPVVCDASSSIFSRALDIRQFDMIYGGAQKNLGPSGCAFVIISRELLERARRDLPTMLRYDVHAAHDSRYNTPNTFAVYLMGRMFKWIREMGGLTRIHARNVEKARILYDHLETSELFSCTVPLPEQRSLVNVTFRSGRPEIDALFCKEAEAEGFHGLRGHPDNGGMRASIYNAFPLEGVRRLVDFMVDFEGRIRRRAA